MADRRVLSRARGFVFLRVFVTFLGDFIKNRLTGALLQEMPIEGVVFERTGVISSHFSHIDLSGLNRVGNLMLFALTLHIPQSSTHVVGPRTRQLITLVLAGIGKVNFIGYILELVLLFGPVHADPVVTGRWAVVLLLAVGYIIEVCLLLSSLALQGVLSGPGQQVVGGV